MINSRSFSINRTLIRKVKQQLYRAGYHSFPDPNEKPKITSFISNVQKQLNKSTLQLDLDRKFKTNTLFPGLPTALSSIKPLEIETKITTLSNGLRIASEDKYSLMTSICFVVKAGSSNETSESIGSTQMLEINAFKSSTKRSHEQLLTDIDNLGGVVQCISTREHIFYCIDILRENVEQAVDILAETILLATYPDKEIEEAKESFVWNYDATPGQSLSRDAAVMASCAGQPLGNPFFIPENRMPLLTADIIRQFKSQHFFGSNCLISGAGIDHDTLVKLIEPRFSGLPKSPLTYTPRVPSKYTGGLYKNERELKEPFARIAIAFKCGGWASDDIVTICVSQILMGGGSSFSAGGPGKGMYSRLYREVLNRCYWVESAESFFAAHDDFGLFGIDASCDLDHLAHLIQISVSELVRLSVEPVKADELSRAKNMVKSLLMSNLESRTITCEDIARQFITLGFREESPSLLKKIDAVTAEDIQRLAQKMVVTPPSVGCVGPDLSRIPKYEDILRFTESTVEEAMMKAGLGKPVWQR